MTRTGKLTRMQLASLLLVMLLGIFSARNSYSSTCEEGRGMPPFLGEEGVTPNILLMIDNSASMFDMAYVDENKLSYCFDESYDNTKSYAGYFTQDVWYKYDTDKFVPLADEPAATNYCSAAPGLKYNHPNAGATELCITVNGNVITAFAAKGNVLNWVAASKMDIQKSVLTGGKYDAADAELIMEARGCQGKRLIKRLDVNDLAGYLTMGIKGDPADDHTLIELYQITDSGFSSTRCYDALDMLVGEDLDPCDPADVACFDDLDFENDPKLGPLKQAVDECLGDPKQNTDAGASNAAFNTALHYCWYEAKHGIEPPGSGHVRSVQNACEQVYPDRFDVGLNPWEINDTMTSYVCYGNYQRKDEENFKGFVGNCWVPKVAAVTLEDGSGQTVQATGERVAKAKARPAADVSEL